MGHVKFETTSQGKGCHDWDYVPLSEERVVEAQIKNRSKLDSAYTLKMYSSTGQGVNGDHVFKEPILCTYIDLDKLIEETEFSKGDLPIIKSLMGGWSLGDISDYCSTPYQTIVSRFRRGVRKIVETNNKKWREIYVRTDTDAGSCKKQGAYKLEPE